MDIANTALIPTTPEIEAPTDAFLGESWGKLRNRRMEEMSYLIKLGGVTLINKFNLQIFQNYNMVYLNN